MNREEKVKRFRSHLNAIREMVGVRAISALAGGPDAHRGKVPKSVVQKTFLQLEEFEFLEKDLRAFNGDRCPDCGGDHPPYAGEFIEKFSAWCRECSDEEFDCTGCCDFGWIHVPVGGCQYGTESDNHPHIEPCEECKTIGEPREEDDCEEATRKHREDCGCPHYHHSCEYYNDEERYARNPIDTEMGDDRTGNDFTVKLIGATSSRAISLIKAVRELTGRSLYDAKGMVDEAIKGLDVDEATALSEGVPYATAKAIVEHLLLADPNAKAVIEHEKTGKVVNPTAQLALPAGEVEVKAESFETWQDERKDYEPDMKDSDDKIDETFKDVGINFKDASDKPTIDLPPGMNHKTAIHWLRKHKEELEKEISIDHKFTGYYPPDAALALHKAIERTYGFVSQEEKATFFGINPPATLSIESDINKIVQIPWGLMSFHGVTGHIETQIALVDGLPVMRLTGLIRKGDYPKIEQLIQLTREVLRTESIYRGKAIRPDFTLLSVDDPGFDPMKAPKFMDVSGTTKENLILSHDISEMVDTNLFVPIENADIARKMGFPLRRGILLAGPFGTGKTLTALVTANVAVAHGWTFIYVTNIKHLPQALQFAKNYAPAVVFAEDLDEVLEGERDEDMNKYLNSMDGVDRKKDEVIVVFTTNSPDDIHPAMMRPGRIDAIIPIDPPDAEATRQLLRMYGRDLIEPNADLTEIGAMLAGQIPAVCREVVERSKPRAIRDARKTNSDHLVITTKHLKQAVIEMMAHVKYINPDKGTEEHPMDVLGDAIGSKIAEAVVRCATTPTIAAAEKGFGELVQEVTKQAIDENRSNGH
jgi:transitional endoplasmic reticulum ATPase